MIKKQAIMSIINLIKSQISPELISQVATQLGESESGVSKATRSLLPAVLGSLADNADKPNVLDAITKTDSNGFLENLLGNSFNNSHITTLLSSIFDEKISGLLNLISDYSGVSNSSASSLLNLVTGATLGSVNKYAIDNNLNTNDITSLLNEQKGLISSLLPAGLSLDSLGLENLLDGTKEETSKVTEKITEDFSNIKKEKTTSSYSSSDENNGSFWKWLLPILLLGLAAWFLWKQCH